MIVNDGSTDATGAIVNCHIAAGRPIVYIAQDNAGLSASRNEALRRSDGEFIAFLDHDDLWESRKLEKQVPLFDRNPRVGVVYSDSINFTADGYEYRHFDRYPPHSGMAFGALLRNYFLNLQTVMVRRRAIDALSEWFDPMLGLVEEADLFLRLARTWELDYIDEPLARWRLHAASTSRTRRDRFPDEMEHLLTKLCSTDPAILTDFEGEVSAFRLETVRLRARIAWEQGRRHDALRVLGPAQFGSWSAFRDFVLFWSLSHDTCDKVRALVRYGRPGRLGGRSGRGGSDANRSVDF